MKTYQAVIGACAFAGAALLPLAAQARVDFDINVGPPPPPATYVVPPPRDGYVWAPGYYDYDRYHHHHIWHDGRWYHGRPGYHWREDRWEQHGDRWHRNHGGWEHD